MTPADPDRDPVDVLAEEFAARIRRGERPSVSAYAAAHPEHADQLRDLLPAVAQMEQLKRFRRAAPASPADGFPDRLGDFRIVRELGRGGMGVVFEAVQESLGRRVALKVLAAHAHLDPERRERFVREAKAAAQLHHTNIVPVFGVGDHAGLSYYVMQLIPGHSLHALVAGWRMTAATDTAGGTAGAKRSTVVGDEAGGPVSLSRDTVVARRPPPVPEPGDWAFVAEVGGQVADALHYAHGQGVLHRDVKPGNLILDDRGQVWVADFGLAKQLNARTLTATGHVLGTLQYLAPECLHGEADVRSDVYGLGATLYELLTLAPPFDADTPVQLMKKIADSSPSPPRALNPHIPRDLETIVLTAMARDPDQRYASAGQLAADLRAFLDDRPIRARRESAVERGWRWCRRNRTVAALAACTLAALVLAAVVGWVGYARTKAALGDKATALAAEARRRAEAEQASAKLEANLRLSLDAFENVFVAAGGDEFRPPPVGGPEPKGGPFGGEAADRAAVLEAVLAFYDKFAEQNATHPQLRFEAAKAHRRVGEMHQWLGRQERAAGSFRRAGELLDGLAAEYPDPAAVRFEQMLAAANAPVEPVGAVAHLERAADLGRGFADAPRRWAVGAVHLKLGWAREQARDRIGAESAYTEAIELLAPDTNRRPPPPNVVVERATARHRLAMIHTATGRLTEARRVLEAAAGELRHLFGDGPPGGRAAREPYAAVCRELAHVLDRLGDPDADRYRAEPKGPPPKGPPPKGPPPKGPPKGPPPRE